MLSKVECNGLTDYEECLQRRSSLGLPEHVFPVPCFRETGVGSLCKKKRRKHLRNVELHRIPQILTAVKLLNPPKKNANSNRLYGDETPLRVAT